MMRRRRSFLIIFTAIIVIGITVATLLVRQNQDVRQRAANDTPTPTPIILDQEEQNFLDILNAHRQGLGLQPLTVSAQLSSASQWMSDDMVQRDFLPPDHIDSLGRTLDQRITDFGYTGALKLSENIASCLETGQSAFDVWLASTAGHKEVMEDPDFTEIGIGRTQSQTSGVWYWTADFGKPASPTSTPTPTNTLAPTQTPTGTLTPTPTSPPAQPQIPTATPTSINTPTPTNTLTPTKTPTGTLTPTLTPTQTPTGTLTPTLTPTQTSTGTLTPMPTPTTLPLAQATATPTQLPPLDTYTPTPTLAPTGGVIQTVGIVGGVIILILGGIFLFIL